ncbi:hypothetical protein BIWAKO_01024 [Bosea sp. BIWAKO-01]|nr:hypothetical protein BIWAKO_01024 [Bosea sp. BIWAKO-01]
MRAYTAIGRHELVIGSGQGAVIGQQRIAPLRSETCRRRSALQSHGLG